MGSHAAVAATLLEDKPLVDAVLADYRTAPVDESWKVLFAFLDTVNARCAEVGPADIEACKAAGWTEEAIYDAITVCALFNFYNRWIDATGVSDLGPAMYAQSGERMKHGGYAPPGHIVLDK
ncbi:MAG: hypothetical protein U0164_17240 [Gemmatimonadaceae bacterium]